MDSGASLGRFELCSRVARAPAHCAAFVLRGEGRFPAVNEKALTWDNSPSAHGSAEGGVWPWMVGSGWGSRW